MGRVAWVEVLDRHKNVVSRQPIDSFPAKIGRGYDCDVILDDPYMAPEHCRIDSFDGSGFALTNLAQINGTQIIGKATVEPTEALTASPEEVMRCGRTQLRIRPVGYAVPAELFSPTNVSSVRPVLTTVAVFSLIAMFFAKEWGSFLKEKDMHLLITEPLSYFVFVLFLALVWTIAGKAFRGRADYFAHLRATCYLLIGWSLIVFSCNVAGFALNWAWLHSLAPIIGMAFVAWIVSIQLVMTLRIGRFSLIALSVLAVASWIGIPKASEVLEAQGRMDYMDVAPTFAPPALILVHGESLDNFVELAGDLRNGR